MSLTVHVDPDSGDVDSRLRAEELDHLVDPPSPGRFLGVIGESTASGPNDSLVSFVGTLRRSHGGRTRQSRVDLGLTHESRNTHRVLVENVVLEPVLQGAVLGNIILRQSGRHSRVDLSHVPYHRISSLARPSICTRRHKELTIMIICCPLALRVSTKYLILASSNRSGSSVMIHRRYM